MATMDGWDITLLIVAGYLAIVSLVRLMQDRHVKVMGRLRADYVAEVKRKRTEEQQAKSEARRKAA